MTTQTTIMVTPREQFSLAARSLQSIVDHTEPPYDLIYVDGRSPRAVKKAIDTTCERHGFRVIRSDRYVTPNQARNLGFAEVETEYVVFVDNDLLVTPGWLEPLVACAEDTGAWAVGPLYIQGPPENREIHMAGGDYTFTGEPGRYRFSTRHRLQGTPLDDLDEPLRREKVDFVEFHCMLVRTEFLRELGPLDEQLLSTREHLDLCIDIAEAGGEVWFEPESLVTYKAPPPLSPGDLRYYRMRWSDDWYRRSLQRFVDKRDLDSSYLDRVTLASDRRRVVLSPMKTRLRSVIGDENYERLATTSHRLGRR